MNEIVRIQPVLRVKKNVNTVLIVHKIGKILLNLCVIAFIYLGHGQAAEPFYF